MDTEVKTDTGQNLTAVKPTRRTTLLKELQLKHGVKDDETDPIEHTQERNLKTYLQENQVFKPDELVPFYESGAILQGATAEVTCLAVEKGVFFSAGRKAHRIENNNHNDTAGTLRQSGYGTSPRRDTEDLIIHGELLVAGCGDGHIYMWHRFKGKLLAKLEHRHAVSCLFLDGKVIWAAYEDMKIRCWGVTEQLLGKVSFDCNGWINAILADNHHVIACCNNKVLLWKKPAESINPQTTAADLTPVAIELVGHTDRVTCVVQDAKTRSLYSCGFDGRICSWRNKFYDKEKGTYESVEYVLDHEFPNIHTDRILCLALREDRLYSGSEDQTIRIIDIIKNEVLISATIKCTARIYSLFVSDHRIFASDSNDSLLVWNRNDTTGVIQILKGPGRVHCLTIDEEGRLYSGGDASVQVWDHVPSKSLVSYVHHRKRISCMAVDEKYFYTGSFDNTIVVWDKTKPVIHRILVGHTDRVRCLCLDDKFIYSGGFDGTIQIWEKATGRYVKMLTLAGNSFEVEEIQYSFVGLQVDASRIYAICEDFIFVWDKETGTLVSPEGKQYLSDKHQYVRSESEIVPRLKVIPKQGSFIDDDADHRPEKSIHLRYFGIDEGIIYIVIRKGTEVIRIKKATMELLEPITKLDVSEITTMAIDDTSIYIGDKDKVIIRPKRDHEYIAALKTDNNPAIREISLEDDTNEYEKLKALYVVDHRLYCGFNHHIKIIDLMSKDNKVLNNPNEDHNKDEWNVDGWHLIVDEGRIYCLSFSTLVKMIDLAIYDLPAFFRQAISSAPLGRYARGLVDKKDMLGRTALGCCAFAGNIQNAIQLLEFGCQTSLSHVDKPGQHSPFFFVLREERWHFLRTFIKAKADHLAKTGQSAEDDELAITIDFNQDPEIFKLLQNRARANDIKFFARMFEFNVKFDGRYILREAIRMGHLELVKFWPLINEAWALHEACFFGKPDCVSALMNRDDIARVNMQDHLHNRQTALHVCFSSGSFSELNYPKGTTVHQVTQEANSRWLRLKTNMVYYFTGTLKDLKWELASDCAPSKDWVNESVFEKFEYNLILKRLECARLLMGAKEASKRPNMSLTDSEGKTVYDKALELHKHSITKSAKPRREIQEREQIQMSKTLFRETSKVCDELNSFSEIFKYRTSFANDTFLKMAGFFFLFLVVLTSVAVLNTTNDEWRQYRMNAAMQETFMGDSFSDVSSVESFWGYVNGTLLPAIYTTNSEEFSQTGFVLGFNRIMGAIQFRQLQIQNDSCTIRNDFDGLLDTCYTFNLNKDDQFKDPYGPGGIYTWKDDGEPFWVDNNIWYPRGGYFTEIPPDDPATGQSVVDSLQANGWITRQTRIIVISLTVYNPNLHGVYSVLQLSFEFSAVGDITSDGKVFVIGPRAYDTSLGWIGIVKIVMEVLLVLFIIREYIFQEAVEMYVSITDSIKESEQIELLRHPRASKKPKKHFWQRGLTWYERFDLLTVVWNRGVRSGLVLYWTELWNYFEWGIIFVFLILFLLRFYCLALFSRLDIDPTSQQYINFLNYAQIEAYQQDLLAIFVLMNWIRLLKFLRIPTYTGPMVQSIMDTLTSRSVLVFFFIIFFELMAFSLAFFIAFGNDMNAFAAFGQSTMSLFQVIFGFGFEYPPLAASNRVFGPIFFVVFMLSINLVLMNLLISVLSESYNTAQTVNEKRWNRYITLLMIETLPLRCQKSEDNEVLTDQQVAQHKLQNEAEVQKQQESNSAFNSITNSAFYKNVARTSSQKNLRQRTFSDPFAKQRHAADDLEIFVLDDDVSSEATYDDGEDGAEDKIVLFQERRVDDWLAEETLLVDTLAQDDEDEKTQEDSKDEIAELRNEVAQLKEELNAKLDLLLRKLENDSKAKSNNNSKL